MMNNLSDEVIIQESLNNREIVGIGKALSDYKKEVLKLQKLPMTADALLESIEIEKSFRKALVNDLRTLIETNCANCPIGYSRSNCEVESCPFKTINIIVNERLKELNQILPGGINEQASTNN